MKQTANSYPFPPSFIWGAATAAAQIEGAAKEDGKGDSIWDAYARIPGNIHNNDTLDVACDHYHRFPEDFRMLRELGVKHYRLSLSWPRIYPDGEGELNPQGIAFYHRLLDALEENGITPWVTFFHWDLPQALEERHGGWLSRKSVDAFARYADTVVKAFGHRVRHWFTINEITCFTLFSYGQGVRPPGLKLDAKSVNQTYHNALLCHGHAVRSVREHGQAGSVVGLVDNPNVPIPLDESNPADVEAARELFHHSNIRIYDPLYNGGYSDTYVEIFGEAAVPDSEPGDFELIAQPCDFLGLNIYTGQYARAGKDGKAEAMPFPSEFPRTSSPWLQILPAALYWGPRHMRDIYGQDEMMITENGCGYVDEPLINGECLDLHRRDLIRNYLRELHRAISDGVNVTGYFVWSLMDNFEWCDGYSIRFGICHMDYETLERTPKLSARWYSGVIRNNALGG